MGFDSLYYDQAIHIARHINSFRPDVEFEIRQTKYEWLYVICAVCPQTGGSSGLLSPYINAEVINIYLRQFRSEITEDVHAVLIWDQAGFHKSGLLDVPENITIIHLPAYSPELNPVENLWH